MRWELGRPSENVEDRRGFSIGPRTGGIGCIGFLVILGIAWLTGTNPLELLQQVSTDQPAATEQRGQAPRGQAPTGYDQERDFVSRILGDTEDTWTRVFTASGRRYEPARLVLFTEAVRSGCGVGSAAVGPFYCPADQSVYLDLTFFRELSRRFGAPGDFAQAYVVAHEVGHHVQALLGLTDRNRPATQAGANAASVRLELQADCFAGVWGYYAKSRMLEPGDVEEGLRAAEAIGDDLLQKRSRGYVNPESFTHGTSEQRARWLMRGLQSGKLDQCDTARESLTSNR
jgi:predicted metalloprotease